MQQKHEEDNVAGEIIPRPATQLQRLLQRSGQIDATRSLGEALVPFFLALVEACWFEGMLIGLAGVDFLHTNVALLPFWGPPLLLCTALWLFQRVLRQEAIAEEAGAREQEQSTRSPAGVGLLCGVLALLAIGLIWLRIYSGTNFLLDPRWLLSFMNDLFLLNGHFYQALALVSITVYFCWRGTRLAQLKIEPGHIGRQMWIGLLVLLASILLRAGRGKINGNFDDLVLIVLIPAFLYFALSAHALARISFVRHAHPFGLEGSIATQERAILSIVGSVGLILLVLTLLGGALFSAAFFSSLQPTWQALSAAYSWFANILSLVIAWILSPIFWLATWLFTFTKNQRTTPPSAPAPSPTGQPHLRPAVTPGIIFATEVILPFLLLLGLMLLVWFALRRRKRLRIARNRASGDVHESVWSWMLFWSQLKAFWAALFRRRSAPDADDGLTQSAEGLSTEPAVRTIREMYRALLKKAATIGYVRRRHETPLEFQQRLNQTRAASNEPQLSQLTEAYALTRYGGDIPDEFDLASVRRDWEALERKWEEPS